MLKNTKIEYALITKAFHWSMALIIMGLLLLGFYMADLDRTPFKFELYGWHKSFGVLILGLVVLRILWKFTNAKVEKFSSHKVWEKSLAKIVHILLYISMIGIPLTGWLMSSAGGHDVQLFGLSLPALITKDEKFGALMNLSHEILAYLLITVIFLHIAGAFKHHFMDKDGTLIRMMAKPAQRFGPYIAVVVAALFFGGLTYVLLLN